MVSYQCWRTNHKLKRPEAASSSVLLVYKHVAASVDAQIGERPEAAGVGAQLGKMASHRYQCTNVRKTRGRQYWHVT